MVARRARTMPTEPASASVTAARAKGRAGAAPAVPPSKAKAGSAAPTRAAPKAPPGSGEQAPAPVAAATRTPPPSKGELRAQIEKLEATNAALKAKDRDATRAARVAARRIAELEGQVAQFQEAAAKAVDPAVATEKLEQTVSEFVPLVRFTHGKHIGPRCRTAVQWPGMASLA